MPYLMFHLKHRYCDYKLPAHLDIPYLQVAAEDRQSLHASAVRRIKVPNLQLLPDLGYMLEFQPDHFCQDAEDR